MLCLISIILYTSSPFQIIIFMEDLWFVIPAALPVSIGSLNLFTFEEFVDSFVV